MAMAICVRRPKRATDPLDAAAKARLIEGYATSSGSEHEALSSLVHAFFDCGDSGSPSPEDAAAVDEPGGGDGKSDSDGGNRVELEPAIAVAELIRGWSIGDPFRLRLLCDVSEAAAVLRGVSGGSAGCRRRAVMVRLREMGHNAGVCKARWEGAGKLVAGSYEYIDVVLVQADGAEERRYIVDLSFSAEFKVARAEERYKRVVRELPEVMVARPEEVRKVVRVVGEAARRSLKAEGLNVPPWRKARYMMAKWLGPYRRTVSEVPASAGEPVAGGDMAKCRAVGFDAAAGASSYAK